MEDKVTFLKCATQEQIDDIFVKTKETFAFRNKNRENLAERFPRFLDTKGLVCAYAITINGIKNNFTSRFLSNFI